MSVSVLTLLISHLLTYIEEELLKDEPFLVEAMNQDIKSFITKLQSLIGDKV